MDRDERGGLIALLLGLGLGVLAGAGHGGIGLGVVAALLIVGGIAWPSTSVVRPSRWEPRGSCRRRAGSHHLRHQQPGRAGGRRRPAADPAAAAQAGSELLVAQAGKVEQLGARRAGREDRRIGRRGTRAQPIAAGDWLDHQSRVSSVIILGGHHHVVLWLAVIGFAILAVLAPMTEGFATVERGHAVALSIAGVVSVIAVAGALSVAALVVGVVLLVAALGRALLH